MQATSSDTRRPELHALTGVRFFAAFAVVFYHYGHALAGPAGSLFERVTSLGYTAVGFFFLLSGFVLSYSYWTGAGTLRGTPKSFWAARIARIYPAYLLAFLLSAPFVIAATLRVNSPLVGAAKAGLNGLLALFLLQSWTPFTAWYWNTPGWSLSTEIFFYAVFPLFVMRVGRLSRFQCLAGAVAVWVIAMIPAAVTCLLTNEQPEPPFSALQLAAEVNPLLRLPEFVIGVLLGRMFVLRPVTKDRENKVQLFGIVALGAVGVAAVLGAAIPRPFLSAGLLAPVTALFIYSLATGQNPLTRLFSTKPLIVLGEASYAVYILQFPVAHLFGIQSGAASAASFIIFAAALCAFSIVTLRFVEAPLRPRIRDWLKGRHEGQNTQTNPRAEAILPVIAGSL